MAYPSTSPKSGLNHSQCFRAGMYLRANQPEQPIIGTSVYPNLVMPPHLGEKPINMVREAGMVINKGHKAQWRLTS